MSDEERATHPLPAPSAELVLLAGLLSVLVSKRRMSKKERMALLRDLGAVLEWFEEYSDVVRIRPRSEDVALAKARREAAAWFRQMVGILASGA